MRFDQYRAAIRFGCGLSPVIAPAVSASDMLSSLRGDDLLARRFPIPGFDIVLSAMVEMQAARKKSRRSNSEAEQRNFTEMRRARNRELRLESAGWFRNTLMRRISTQDGFRERLAFFWADHFTARGTGGVTGVGYMPYVEEAIRPHVSGRFADILKAVVTHPFMIDYLDQTRSAGPNSRIAKRNARFSGLNENLAREVLELHTLGVDGPYTQDDVRQLAELFTGLSISPEKGFMFRRRFAEPGAETVLGKRYGGDPARLSHVFNALEDLATHPATAKHIARKLAVHFVSDAPETALIEALEMRFKQTSGDLLAVYEVLLEHPDSWSSAQGNVKQPIDFIASSLRALAPTPDQLPTNPRAIYRDLVLPMSLMGQPWGAPLGPDGWPEADGAWITPQRMAARLQWGMAMPYQLRSFLPDPRRFARDALGPDLPKPVEFAAKAAETRSEAVGVVLCSPAFQRM
ncbi:MAG: DUF1800 domain-containing protein [Pseudomonadota bacterium]